MNEYDRKMMQLADRFAARLASERRALVRARNDQQAMIACAHNLAGIAGIFGRADIGSAAFALEERLRAGDAASDEFAALCRLLDPGAAH